MSRLITPREPRRDWTAIQDGVLEVMQVLISKPLPAEVQHMSVNNNSEMNSELFPDFAAFAHRILSLLEGWCAASDCPTLSSHPVIIENGSYRRAFESMLDFGSVLKRHFEEICDLAEANTCARRHYDSGAFGHLVTDLEQQRVERHDRQFQFWSTFGQDLKDEWGFQEPVSPPETPLSYESVRRAVVWHLLKPILELVETNCIAIPATARLEEVCSRHCLSWQSDGQIRQIIAPLLGFESELDTIVLGSGYEIRRFTDQMKMDFCNTWHGDDLAASYLIISDIVGSKHCLYALDTVPKSEKMFPFGQKVPSAERAVARVRSIMTAFRLTKAGDIGAPVVFNLPESKWIGNDVTLVNGLESFNTGRGSQKYKLAHEDLDPLRATVEALVNDEVNVKLRLIEVGLWRFNRACSRDSLSDATIDLAIALENLLLRSREKAEPSGECAGRRATILLGNENGDEVVYETLVLLFKVRNAVVHRGYEFDEACRVTKVSSADNNWAFREDCQAFWNNCLEVARKVYVTIASSLVGGVTMEELIASLDRARQRAPE